MYLTTNRSFVGAVREPPLLTEVIQIEGPSYQIDNHNSNGHNDSNVSRLQKCNELKSRHNPSV
jgi:hypothetical protein